MSARASENSFTVEWSPGLPRGFSFDGPAEAGLALQPTGLAHGAAAEAAIEAGFARPLAGGPVAFSACIVHLAGGGRLVRSAAPLAALEDWAAGEAAETAAAVAARLARLVRARAPFAGLALDRARLVGVLNVTPDSFSDGGDFADPDAAVAHGLRLAEAGADLVEVGGESTRPGAAPTPPETEAARVVPVIAALAERGVAVAVDTRRASVMEAALDAGARVVNDVTALAGDPGAAGLVAAREAGAVLMHMQGEPGTMQRDPRYADAPYEVFRFLDRRVAALAGAGIPGAALAVDPGIGFGKTVVHNARILAAIGLLHGTGCAVMLGASRKSFIARLSRGEPAKARLPGSLAAAAAAAFQGVQLFRVHDVAETRQALAILASVGAAGVT